MNKHYTSLEITTAIELRKQKVSWVTIAKQFEGTESGIRHAVKRWSPISKPIKYSGISPSQRPDNYSGTSPSQRPEWLKEHALEIVNYFKEGNSKTATMTRFGLNEYSLSVAFFFGGLFYSIYPSMLNQIKRTYGKIIEQSVTDELQKQNMLKPAMKPAQQRALPTVQDLINPPQNGFRDNLIAFVKTYETYEKALPGLQVMIGELKAELNRITAERDRWKNKAENLMTKMVELQQIMAKGD